MDTAYHVCLDKNLSDVELDEARVLSIALNPGNRGSALELAGIDKWLWPPGYTPRVSFLGGEPALHRRIEHFAREWCQYANIQFDFLPYKPGKYPEAEIRIGFVQDGMSWSYIGTQALVKKDPMTQTMNFGRMQTATRDTEVQRTVLHEFGHALGCIHEHQHPKAAIPWNKPVVYSVYARSGLTLEEVDQNVFKRYEADMINSSAYDPRSIMHYPIDAALRTDGKAIAWNTELSDMDKQHIAELYPAQPAKSK